MTVALLCLLGCSAHDPPSPEPSSQGEGEPRSVRITVLNVSSNEGSVLINLFLTEDGFPYDNNKAFFAKAIPAVEGQVHATVVDVPPGLFAISAFHDADDDRELTTGLLGIPVEDYGFSNSARDTFGPPSFSEAAVDFGREERIEVQVELD